MSVSDVCTQCCSDQPMDGGSSMFGSSSLFGGLGGQPSAAKANTNVFGAVSFAAGQQASGCQSPSDSILLSFSISTAIFQVNLG